MKAEASQGVLSTCEMSKTMGGPKTSQHATAGTSLVVEATSDL